MQKTLLALLLLASLTVSLSAQTPAGLDEKTIAENRELDRMLIEAHEQRNLDKLADLFVRSPETFFIAPNGAVFQGWDQMRESYRRFFAGLESISAEIKDVKYLRAGEGVIAVGTVVFHRKDRSAPLRDLTVVWTDYRRRESGRWKYLFRHAHWPLSTQPAPTAH